MDEPVYSTQFTTPWGHLTRSTVKDPSFMPRASWDPSLLKETLRTDSSMLQRASRVWSGRLHSLRDRQTDRWAINSTYQQPSGGGVSDRPDGAVVAPGDGDRLFGVEVECPQFALTVTLHQQNRFVPVSDHDLEDLAVLRSRQDPVGLPADAADGQTWNRKHSWLFMKKKLYATPSACLTEHMMCWSSSTAAANVLLDRFDTSVKWLDPF